VAYLPEDPIAAHSSSTLGCKLVVGDVQGDGHLVVLVVALAVPAMLVALVMIIVAVVVISVLVL
jgi:hypothetical protein